MAGKASPIRLRTWVWILAGLFVVCTLPLMAIALVQGTLRYTGAEDNLTNLRQLRQTFDLANLASAERGPANSLLGADPADAAEQARLAAQLAAARKRVDTAMLQLETEFKNDPGVLDERGLLADAPRRLQSARAAVDRVVAQPHDARRVEAVERAISGMFAVVDRLHLLTSAQINVLVSADREAAIPAMQGQVLIDLREHGGRLGSDVLAPVAVPAQPGAPAPVPRPPDAETFVGVAHSSAVVQARAAELVASRETRPEVHSFAQKMVEFRRGQIARLEDTARQKNVPVPTQLQFEHRLILENLEPLDSLELSRR